MRQTIDQHGPDSVAFYVSGQILTEDYYVANKLMKGFIGSANIDTNSRLCMASSVAGHKRAFGSDTVPGTYEDLELADLVVLVGSNLAWCHPVLYQRLADAKAARPEMKVVLIDPRRTATADLADLHLPIAADGDTALYMGLLAYLYTNGSLDPEFVLKHTNGFAEALISARTLSQDQLATATGLTKDQLKTFYDLFARNPKTVTVYSQGVNQSAQGTDKVGAILNCHLATGRIGKPGMGPFSVTGQPNAMGGREVGGLANMLAAHMDIDNQAHRETVAGFWQAPNLAKKPGLKAVDMFDAVADGRIKALWIMATNPADSLPNAGAVEAAIAGCDFVVVSDILQTTDTVRHAHVKLPATAWGEKDGTVTNSERRISRQRAFLPPPGETRPDWWHFAEVARRMGFESDFGYPDAHSVFAEHVALSDTDNEGRRDFTLAGLRDLTADDFANLDPVQWPVKQPADPQDTRFFADGRFYTPNGKANFVIAANPLAAVAAVAAAAVQGGSVLSLNTGRIRDHWHTMTRTGRSVRNSAHISEPYCEIHPEDALASGVGDADLVRLQNDFGNVVLRALITDRVPQGSVFAPMHWTDQFASNARIDRLVPPLTDPYSGQPASKNVSVSLHKCQVARFGFLLETQKPDQAFLDALDYWALAATAEGWRLEFAISETANLPFDLATASMSYRADKSTDRRLIWLEDDQACKILFLSHRPVGVSRAWACEQLGQAISSSQSAMQILAGRPAANQPDKGPIVCSYFSVGTNQIRTAIGAGCRDVAEVGRACQAGTNCGSCRSEIGALLHEALPIAAE